MKIKCKHNGWKFTFDPSRHLNNNSRRKRGVRRGVSILIVLFLMTFGMAIIFGLLTFSMNHQRQLARQLQAEQANWMIEAGLGWAINQLAIDPDYQGETIQLDLPLKHYTTAEIKIAVSSSGADDQPAISVNSKLVAAEGTDSTVRKSIQVRGSRGLPP